MDDIPDVPILVVYIDKVSFRPNLDLSEDCVDLPSQCIRLIVDDTVLSALNVARCVRQNLLVGIADHIQLRRRCCHVIRTKVYVVCHILDGGQRVVKRGLDGFQLRTAVAGAVTRTGIARKIARKGRVVAIFACINAAQFQCGSSRRLDRGRVRRELVKLEDRKETFDDVVWQDLHHWNDFTKDITVQSANENDADPHHHQTNVARDRLQRHVNDFQFICFFN
mmetsp:Transcript_26172/g.68875  ORF Transcript_26172/g.68875 Transcript_26172/m.68875 type:complete len:223 (+) Transcript_26172:627-1295(+)